MKIVVIGSSVLIGSKVVSRLRAGGHELLAASPASGVDTLTGEGLDEALAGAFEDKAVMEFFQTSGQNPEVSE